jgi:hypothetical protein
LHSGCNGGFVTASHNCLPALPPDVCLQLAIFAYETLPERSVVSPAHKVRWGGYGQILQDRPFMAFIITFTLTQMCATMIWVLLGVYMKQNFLIPETQWGFIATTNALMVVLLQLPVTQITKRYAPLGVLAVGALFYAAGVGAWCWEVVLGILGEYGNLTIGELIWRRPVAYTASLARRYAWSLRACTD